MGRCHAGSRPRSRASRRSARAERGGCGGWSPIPSLDCLPGRARGTRETRDRVQGMGHSDRHIAPSHRRGPGSPRCRATAGEASSWGGATLAQGQGRGRRADRQGLSARDAAAGRRYPPSAAFPGERAARARPGIASKEWGTRIAILPHRHRRGPGSPRRRATAGEASSWGGATLAQGQGRGRRADRQGLSARDAAAGRRYPPSTAFPGERAARARPGIASKEWGTRIAILPHRHRRGPGSPRCRATAGEASSWGGGTSSQPPWRAIRRLDHWQSI